MKFYYNFPAVKGRQAGREYYVSMVPISLLEKLFPSDEEYVLPEFRAQRRINESRIPEIKKYILDNRTSYVFSALSASIDGDFSFNPIEKDADIGTLNVSMDSIFLINDGQHRKAAILEAIKEDESLLNETISLVFFKDDGLKRSQQMFTDLNKHAVKTSNSLSTLYDSRDAVAVATKNVIESVLFFKKYTDKERDILGKNSSKLFTLNTLYKSNLRILHSKSCSESDQLFLIKYWTTVANNMTNWNELMNKEITKRDLRENYIVTLAITMTSLGKIGRLFYDNRNISFEEHLTKLKEIDWSRTNSDWIGRTIKENGKVMNSEEAINLTYNRIKQLIGL